MSQLSTKIEHRKALEEILESLSISHCETSLEKLLEFSAQVIHWNTQTNLTGAKDVLSFLRGPLFDALTLIPVLGQPESLLDVGTGAGLPGIPAKFLHPDLELTLLEPRAKRVTFLNHVTKSLSSITVIKGKDTTLEKGRWTAAVAQAVWAPDQWLARAQDILVPGGTIYTLCSSQVTYDPKQLQLEAEFRTHRTSDGAPRYAYRFKKS